MIEDGADRQLSHGGHSSPRLYRDPNHENIIGARGEFAFARRYNLPLPARWDGTNDPGYDFMTRHGGLDIKASAKRPWFLPLKEADYYRNAATLFVLAWARPDEAEFMGWAWRSDFERRGEHYQGPLQRSTLIIRVEHLRDMQGLVI